VSENADETRWVSFAELAEARGIDKLSAIRMARRRGWPKQIGNDGTVRVLVPPSVLDGKRYELRDISSDIATAAMGETDKPNPVKESASFMEPRIPELVVNDEPLPIGTHWSFYAVLVALIVVALQFWPLDQLVRTITFALERR
jgi:hypothetical protein